MRSISCEDETREVEKPVRLAAKRNLGDFGTRFRPIQWLQHETHPPRLMRHQLVNAMAHSDCTMPMRRSEPPSYSWRTKKRGRPQNARHSSLSSTSGPTAGGDFGQPNMTKIMARVMEVW